MSARKPPQRVVPQGRFAVVHGRELPLRSSRDRGWYVLSDDEHPGLSLRVSEFGEEFYSYVPKDSEWLACVEYRSRAVYRGLELEAEATGNGKFLVVVHTSHIDIPVTDQQANEAGLDFREPGLWSKVVELDDPDLVVTTTRTPIRPPWLPEEGSV